MATPKDASFDMWRRLRVADYLTLSNAFCGVLSIFCSMQRNFVAANLLIILGYECDCFDGRVARWMKQTSDWGKELDSFSDLISFVVAPAVMVYCAGYDTAMDQAIAAFFVLCGLLRLARFNVIVSLVPRNALGRAMYMEGLPTAYAGIIITSAVALADELGLLMRPELSGTLFAGSIFETHHVMLAVLILAAAMASKRLRFTFDGVWAIPAMTAAVFLGCRWTAPLETK